MADEPRQVLPACSGRVKGQCARIPTFALAQRQGRTMFLWRRVGWIQPTMNVIKLAPWSTSVPDPDAIDQLLVCFYVLLGKL